MSCTFLQVVRYGIGKGIYMKENIMITLRIRGLAKTQRDSLYLCACLSLSVYTVCVNASAHLFKYIYI